MGLYFKVKVQCARAVHKYILRRAECIDRLPRTSRLLATPGSAVRDDRQWAWQQLSTARVDVACERGQWAVDARSTAAF